MENKEYKDFLIDTFKIELNKENEKYFYGVISVNNPINNEYCSKILGFKGDPLISFMVCDREMDGMTLGTGQKLLEFTKIKESKISDKLFASIFDKYGFQRFTDHNKSNRIGKKIKSSCIEALVYAIYKTSNIEFTWECFKKMLSD